MEGAFVGISSQVGFGTKPDSSELQCTNDQVAGQVGDVIVSGTLPELSSDLEKQLIDVLTKCIPKSRIVWMLEKGLIAAGGEPRIARCWGEEVLKIIGEKEYFASYFQDTKAGSEIYENAGRQAALRCN